MKKYAVYKPSGVEWLGDVPAHWEVKRLKFISNGVKTGGTPPSVGTDYFDETGINWYNPGDFGALHLGEAKKKLLPEAFSDGVCKLFPAGSVLIVGIGATLGKIGLATEPSGSNQQINAITPTEEVVPDYLAYYLIAAGQEIISTSSASTLGILNQEKTKQIICALPPLPEQRAIAAFLDARMAHLDGLIRRKEDLLKLLAEQRAALITRAVTRGLDTVAPLRNSGVPWLGQVPAHWEVKRLKFLVASIRGGGTPATGNPDFWNGPIPWVSPKDMKVDRISSTEDYVTELALENSSTELVAVDSILLVVRSGILKHTLPVAINTVPVALNQDIKAVIPTKEVTPEYLALLLKGLQSEILAFCTKISATVDSIEMDDLVNFDLPIPPLEEQVKICAFITSESAKILPTITAVEKTVEKLREYRAALIMAAVTGRIYVRAAVPTTEPALTDAL